MSEQKIDPDIYPASAIASLMGENERLKAEVEYLKLEGEGTQNAKRELAEVLGVDEPRWKYMLREAKKVVARAQAAKRRVEDAMKVLEPFANLGDIVLAEAPASSEAVNLYADCENNVHTVGLDDFRAARRFIKEAGE